MFPWFCACVWKDESVVEGGTGEMKKASDSENIKKKEDSGDMSVL